jgi:hypothetical protein
MYIRNHWVCALTYGYTCSVHQQTETSLTSIEMLYNQESYRTATNIWGIQTKGKEMAGMQYDARHGSGLDSSQQLPPPARNLAGSPNLLLCRMTLTQVQTNGLEKQAAMIVVNRYNHWPVWISILCWRACSTCGIKMRVGPCIGECLKTNPRHGAVYRSVQNLGHPSKEVCRRKYLLCMFPVGQFRVIPRGPVYGLSGPEQVQFKDQSRKGWIICKVFVYSACLKENVGCECHRISTFEPVYQNLTWTLSFEAVPLLYYKLLPLLMNI